jgi:hypothetical protein
MIAKLLALMMAGSLAILPTSEKKPSRTGNIEVAGVVVSPNKAAVGETLEITATIINRNQYNSFYVEVFATILPVEQYANGGWCGMPLVTGGSAACEHRQARFCTETVFLPPNAALTVSHPGETGTLCGTKLVPAPGNYQIRVYARRFDSSGKVAEQDWEETDFTLLLKPQGK